jgi:hypothetical protein
MTTGEAEAASMTAAQRRYVERCKDEQTELVRSITDPTGLELLGLAVDDVERRTTGIRHRFAIYGPLLSPEERGKLLIGLVEDLLVETRLIAQKFNGKEGAE